MIDGGSMVYIVNNLIILFTKQTVVNDKYYKLLINSHVFEVFCPELFNLY